MKKEGARRATVRKDLPFNPIRLKRKPAADTVSDLRYETWISGNHTRVFCDTYPSHGNRNEGLYISPVERMQGRILLSNPEHIRHIIFNPSLELDHDSFRS